MYKDVTELVRAHAKPDSIRMPVVIGLLTDPFPNTHKHLSVTYSFAREWEVRANEGEELVLPEKYGEEQSVREIQAMKAKLNSMVDPENAFIVKLSETEYSLYRQLESSFNALQMVPESGPQTHLSNDEPSGGAIQRSAGRPRFCQQPRDHRYLEAKGICRGPERSAYA